MISVIIYGRNDGYGYNLHKRAALSLNSIGHLLTAPTDEIIFVDYNTPSSFPTFPEAIGDTLTGEVWKKLRILRVTEDIHNSLRIKTHLKTLEPIARNVALRRSNPNNRWVLSTNSDMIFVPKSTKSMSEIVAHLEDGQYGIPRFELPEGLWESLDRLQPRKVIEQLRSWGERFSLNVPVLSWEPHIFDAPGDFQLFLREDLIAIDGFDERMTRGWHVDSNISKRVSMLRGNVRDLSDELHGYHCDHTRQETPMHAPKARQNSALFFIDMVRRAPVPQQRLSWGLANKEIEELGLEHSASSRLLKALANVGYEQQSNGSPRRYNASGYNRDWSADFELAPHLLDFFLSLPRGSTVEWVGKNIEIWRTLQEMCKIAECDLNFIAYSPLGSTKKVPASFPNLPVEVIVFDFRPEGSRDSSEAIPADQRATTRLLLAFFQNAFRRNRLRHVVGINVVNNSYEAIFNGLVNCMRSPYGVGFRHGKFAPLNSSTISFLFSRFARAPLSMLRRKLIRDENVYSWLLRKIRS